MAKKTVLKRGAKRGAAKRQKKKAKKDKRGKTSDKEKAIVMEKLRALGYM
jgi:hypothetical protein